FELECGAGCFSPCAHPVADRAESAAGIEVAAGSLPSESGNLPQNLAQDLADRAARYAPPRERHRQFFRRQCPELAYIRIVQIAADRRAQTTAQHGCECLGAAGLPAKGVHPRIERKRRSESLRKP